MAAAGGLAPAFFDAAGQPVVATKMSTVGTASATESVSGGTAAAGDDQEMGDGLRDEDEDMLSMDTSYRETEMDSASGYLGTAAGDADTMEDLASRSVGGFEDRMSDDGNASLVGFGEGAGSTVSGPIYHRRVVPGSSSAGAVANVWGLERSGSGLSEGATLGGGRRDTVRGVDREGTDAPVIMTAAMERREARMVDGVATDNAGLAAVPGTARGGLYDDLFVDTTTRGPVPIQPNISAIRETQQPGSYQQRPQAQYPGSTSREAAERIVRERLDGGEGRAGAPTLGNPKGAERLGRFYFE
jgi:hypothetical protein